MIGPDNNLVRALSKFNGISSDHDFDTYEQLPRSRVGRAMSTPDRVVNAPRETLPKGILAFVTTDRHTKILRRYLGYWRAYLSLHIICLCLC